MPESDARSVEQTLWLTSYTSTAVQNQNFWNICYSCRDNWYHSQEGTATKNGRRSTDLPVVPEQPQNPFLAGVKSVKTDSHTHTEQP